MTEGHFEIDVRIDGIVWLKRTSLAYAELGDIAAAYREIAATVDAQLTSIQLQRVARGDKGPYPFAWLYDLRDAPPARNDTAFEQAQTRYTPLLFDRSALLCTLCATETGLMQIKRMSQAVPGWFATCDEAFAVAELRRMLRESKS